MSFVFLLFKKPVGEIPYLKAKNDVSRIITGIKMYKLDNGLYPSTKQGLKALVTCPTTGKIPTNWSNRGYVKNKELLKDPWGNEYIYSCPGKYEEFDVWSYGKDGKPGGSGDNKDICSWEIEDEKPRAGK